MTHDHSALISQLDALKGADPASMFAELIGAGFQAPIDTEATEATEVLGVDRYERNNKPRLTQPAYLNLHHHLRQLWRHDAGMSSLLSTPEQWDIHAFYMRQSETFRMLSWGSTDRKSLPKIRLCHSAPARC